MPRIAGLAALLTLAGTGLLAGTGCAGASGPRGAAVEGGAAPRLGMPASETLEILHATPADGGYRIEVTGEFVSRIEDGVWHEVPPAAAAGSGAENAHLAMVARRECSDWELGGENGLVNHHTQSRASWFLLREGGLVAWDHWTFGPACEPANSLRPAVAPDRDTERTLLRFVDQRYPDPLPSIEIRFQRGHAYLAVGRLKDAQRMLRSGDRAIDVWIGAFRYHELPAERRAALDEREAELRRQRADLSVAIDRMELERDGPPEDPTERYFRGIDP
jgi:hypothetical protein